jgi:hypothetical protein
MSDPEIDRRCKTCGASIREAAAFCPQCGEELAPQDLQGKPTTSVVTTPLVELAGGEKDANPPPEPVAEKLKTTEKTGTSYQAQPGSKPPLREGPEGKPRKTPVGKVRDAPVGKVRDRIQRAGNLARDVEGDMKHRVQKVRQISSVVLDEAGYDPSLRFVLVAAALFILFLLVLVLNKMIG